MGPIFKKEVVGSKANLIYKATKDDVIDSISLRMLVNNQIKGISQLTHRKKNNEDYFIFDISHKSTIRDLFESPIEKKKLLDVLTGILTVISSAEEYILESSRFIFDLDYIFINVSTFETQMIYLPVDTYKKTEAEIVEFFKNLLINVNFNPLENYYYIAQIMIFLNTQTRCLPQDFNTMLKEMLEEFRHTNNDDHENNESNQLTQQESFGSLDTQQETNESIESNETDRKFTLSSFFTNIFGRKKPLETSNPRYTNSEFGGYKPIRQTADMSVPDDDEEEETLIFEETSVLNPDANGNQNYPYLIRLKNNERIPINKHTFNIGREKSNVDYCISDSRFVGRKHAIILSKDNAYYIVDANTVNHTYVNSNKIPGGVETKIEHGERITMANEEFEFNLY